MKIAIIAPDWGNSWIPIFKKLIEEAGHEYFHFLPDTKQVCSVDAYIHMWAVDNQFLKEEGYHAMFMRRYEFYKAGWVNLPWHKINHLIFCNDWIKQQVDSYFKENSIKQQTHLIYNALDPKDWTYRDRSHGTKIGMACHIHSKKNIPLAVQVLECLPYGYELHIAGGIQEVYVAEYIHHIGLKLGRKIRMYGQIPREDLDRWWDDKHYCISSSLSEGNPNNVLEAMAKGIKPITHGWPGAETQFPVFYTAMEAATDILRGNYCSSDYLKVVKDFHSLDNYRSVINLIERR